MMNLHANFGNEAHNKAKDRHDPQKNENDMIEIYNEILGG